MAARVFVLACLTSPFPCASSLTRQPFPPLPPTDPGAAPKTTGRDVAVYGWAGLTVRVAWTLLSQGVKLKPGVLRDARDHVLYHLDPTMPLPHAEDLAGTLTLGFVQRARRGGEIDAHPNDGVMLLSPRWRRAIDHSLSPLTECVFRQHFGDGRSLDYLERALQVDRIALEGARGGLREVLRRVAISDGVPLGDWSSQRIDRLLCRLAAFSAGPCPAVHEILAGGHTEHTRTCARCDRMSRLLSANLLSYDELLPPPLDTRPDHHVEVLALHFHPDGKGHRARIISELDVSAFPVGDDILLVDYSRRDEVDELLVLASEVAAPHRDHLRGAVLEGCGRWSRHGLLGPIAVEAPAVVRSRAWSTVDGIGELPAPLPPPPSARGWWIAAASMAAAAALGLAIVAQPVRAAGDRAGIEFTAARGGYWTAFDTGETDLVTIVHAHQGRLRVVLASQHPADKIAYATGDGSYRMHTMGSGVLVAVTKTPIARLDKLVGAAQHHQGSLVDLARRIEVSHPGARVELITE